MMKYRRGFTLIEVMVVVAIVGLLVLVALPTYQAYRISTEINSCLKLITPARTIADNIIVTNNGSVTAITNADSINLTAGSYCDGVSATNAGGVVTISATSNGNQMTWTRNAATGVWRCTSSNPELAPETCP